SSRPNLPRRNRTIAGLSHATIVVRATTDSGALITATSALEQGRPLFAIPGDPADELSSGPNGLIRAGAARPTRSARELLNLLDWTVGDRPTTPTVDIPPTTSTVGIRPSALPAPSPLPGPALGEVLEGPSRDLWAVLDERRAMHVDALAERVRVPAHEALRWLTELELKGLCRQRPGKYFLRQTPWSVNPNGSAG